MSCGPYVWPKALCPEFHNVPAPPRPNTALAGNLPEAALQVSWFRGRSSAWFSGLGGGWPVGSLAPPAGRPGCPASAGDVSWQHPFWKGSLVTGGGEQGPAGCTCAVGELGGGGWRCRSTPAPCFRRSAGVWVRGTGHGPGGDWRLELPRCPCGRKALGRLCPPGACAPAGREARAPKGGVTGQGPSQAGGLEQGPRNGLGSQLSALAVCPSCQLLAVVCENQV